LQKPVSLPEKCLIMHLPTKVKLVSKFQARTVLEVIAILCAIVVSYYEFREFNPPDPVIILEVNTQTGANQAPMYMLTGVAADKDYLLEYIKLYLQTPYQVKRAYFKYGLYTQPVELQERENQALDAYVITSELLQQTFEEDDNFAFHFPNSDGFTFYFEFEPGDKEMVAENMQFRCETQAIEHVMVPCEIKEAGYLSLARGIPWYLLAVILGVILIIVIEVIFKLWQFFRHGNRQKNRNRLTPDKRV
jgi:hypothetical protein